MSRRLVKLKTLYNGNKFQYGGKNYMVIIPTHEMKYLTGNYFIWVVDLATGDLVFIDRDAAVITHVN